MLHMIRKHVTYANIAIIAALVFAMSGGAYAASKILITSTKQISPKVLKALQGKAGPAGKEGPAGREGPAGKEGAPGKDGVQGEKGVSGKDGTTGQQGLEGKEGSPWTVNGNLPPGKSEYGQWSDLRQAANLELEYTAISFPVPLATTTEAHFIGPKEGENEPEAKWAPSIKEGKCKGDVAAPQAAKGNLCVFANTMQFASFAIIWNAEEEGPAELAGRGGAVLLLEATKTEFDGGFGTWVVTAK
jgi:hypothetical protein